MVFVVVVVLKVIFTSKVTTLREREEKNKTKQKEKKKNPEYIYIYINAPPRPQHSRSRAQRHFLRLFTRNFCMYKEEDGGSIN